MPVKQNVLRIRKCEHRDDGSKTRDGFGDSQVRLKMNFWGNDRGETAFGFMPFINAPTASDGLGNNHVEGGLIFPFAADLNEDVELGLMFETDFVFDETDDGYETDFARCGCQHRPDRRCGRRESLHRHDRSLLTLSTVGHGWRH